MPNNSQHAVKFACQIVQDVLGDVPHDVCRSLLQFGQQNLMEINRSVKRPLPIIQKALLVLIQHNFVEAYQRPEEVDVRGVKPACHFYQANLQTILQTIRKPKFLLHILEEMNEVAEAVMELLFIHGRLRLDQITAAVSSKLSSDLAEGAEPVTMDHVRNVFMSLLNSHYIERAPPANLLPPTKKSHPDSIKTKKTLPKPGTREFAEYQAQQLALQKGPDAMYAKKRFQLPKDLLMSGLKLDGEESSEDEIVVKRGAKRRKLANGQAASEKEKEGDSSDDDKNVLWRVNLEELNRRFRHKACVEVITDKLNKDAGTVLAAMLAISRSFETQVQQAVSQPLGEDEIAGQLNRLVAAGALPNLENEKDVSSIIRSISNLSLGYLDEMGQGPAGTIWQMNLQRFVDTIRMREMEDVIRGRYGVEGVRVFRLLLLRGQLEQKQIGDFAMLPQKETRELVFKMVQGGAVHMQDIPRTNERAPAKTFYTFYINMQAFADRLASDLYRTAFNLRARMKHEVSKHKEVMDLLEVVRETGRLDRELTAAQGREVEQLRNISQVLDASLLRLDDMIAIFNDY